MTAEEQKYRLMTETGVGKLIIRLSIPTMISMMITTIYNTADTFFVSKISVSASGATGIVFSLMAILQAFGFMLGHGAGSNISRLLGARHVERASTFISTSFFLAISLGILIGCVGLLFLEPFMLLLGSTETILPEAKAYATYLLLAAPAMMTSCVLNNVLRYEGLAFFSMIGLASGGILNICLDPLLIFVFGLGTAGAGLATAISQYIGVFILLRPFLRGKTASKIALRSFTRSPGDIGNIVLTGFPSLIRQGMNSIATTLLNVQASVYGDAAIAAFSIVNRVSGLLFSAALGLGQGLQPVCAFNYGAKKYRRVRQAFLFTFLLATGLLAAVCILCLIRAESIVMLFRKDSDVVRIGSETLRYTCIGLIALPASALSSMLFQSAGKKGRAIFIAMLQSGAIFIPLLLLLPRFLGLFGLELSHPAAYAISGFISLPISLSFLRTLKQEEELLTDSEG